MTRSPLLISTVLTTVALANPSRADTLAEAISLAYQTNPTLLSQRAQLLATNETYVQAEAGFRPTANLQGTANYGRTPQTSLFGGVQEVESNSGAAAITLTQPLYAGGRVTAQVRGAKAEIDAGREQLRATEASIILSTVQAYCDVLRDRASLAIQQAAFKELKDATDEIRARYEAGANTITDREQARAQLEASRALVESARAQLGVSVAEYIAAVGQTPGDLAPPPPLPGLPADVDQAFDICQQESPALRQAEAAEVAARAGVQQAQAARRPTVSLSGQYGYAGPLEPYNRRSEFSDASATLSVSQPLFEGGVIASQVRQALAQDTSARVQVEAARRSAIQSVSQNWSQARAAHANTVSEQAAVTAAQSTFDGMRVEYRAGLRTTLDVLIAQETLRDAQIALADARHDDYVADAALLGAIGRLEARTLLQGQPLYSPEAAFRQVKDRGGVPWQAIPATLDRIGAPGPVMPAPLPEAGEPEGLVQVKGEAPSQ